MQKAGWQGPPSKALAPFVVAFAGAVSPVTERLFALLDRSGILAHDGADALSIVLSTSWARSTLDAEKKGFDDRSLVRWLKAHCEKSAASILQRDVVLMVKRLPEDELVRKMSAIGSFLGPNLRGELITLSIACATDLFRPTFAQPRGRPGIPLLEERTKG
jgi:hypothetical protein